MKPAEQKPGSPASDRELVKRLKTGDGAALERLYEAHVDGLYAFVYYRVGRDAALAEDVVQETFLAALDRLAAYDPDRGAVRSWLCTLSRNVMRRHTRDRDRGQGLWDRIDHTLEQVYASLESDPLTDEVIARQETRDLVNMTIANLPERYRRALEQKYVDGSTVAELAERLAVSEEAAKSLLARARRAFRETFVTLCRALSEVPS